MGGLTGCEYRETGYTGRSTEDVGVRRSVGRSQPDRPQLTIPLDKALAEFGQQAERGREIQRRQITSRDALDTARDDYQTWTEYVSQLIRVRLTSDAEARQFETPVRWVMSASNFSTVEMEADELREDVGTHVRRLESLIARLPLFAPTDAQEQSTAAATRSGTRVFVVHGHDPGPRDAAARLLTKLRLDPLILEEQPNQGRTIIEKVEAYRDVVFAVVVMTGDDVGREVAAAGELSPRARQNARR